MNVNRLSNAHPLRQAHGPQPRAQDVAAPATRACDQFSANATSPFQLNGDGVITGPSGRLGRIEPNFDFTLQLGGQEVKGNLLELLVRSLVEEVVKELGLEQGAQQPGDRVTADGRGYDVVKLVDPRPSWLDDAGGTRVPSTGTGATGTSGPTPTPTPSTTSTRPTPPTTSGTTGTSPTARGRDVDSENASLPIWRGFGSRSAMDPFLERMRRDTHSPAEKQAAIARLDEFSTQMGWSVEKSALHENRSTFVPEALASGLIYDDGWYKAMRGFKDTLTGDLKRVLGRDPTMDEVYRYVPQLGQLPFDTETIERIQETAQRAIARDAGNTLTRYTDAEVNTGVRDYLRQHPNATEAEVRLVAKNQYGVSDAQLDRVKATFFSNAPTTPARPPQPTTTQPPPSRPTYTDRQVADGVREYIRAHPGATEAEIRQVAQSQYGVSSEQLDRVKRDFFS